MEKCGPYIWRIQFQLQVDTKQLREKKLKNKRVKAKRGNACRLSFSLSVYPALETEPKVAAALGP